MLTKWVGVWKPLMVRQAHHLCPVGTNGSHTPQLIFLGLVNNQLDQPALILAAQQNRPDALNYLLDQIADLTVVDAYGNNALRAACFAEAPDCITALLKAGIDIDHQNPSGATALIYASVVIKCA